MNTDLTIEKTLIQTVRYILHPDRGLCAPELADWNGTVAAARKHGVFPYLYRYMRRLPEEQRPPADTVAYMEELNARELRAGILQEYAAEELQKGLEAAGMDHMFFKGTVTKGRYPDPYLRTMGDVDILYAVGQHARLRPVMESLGFSLRTVGRVHDVYENPCHTVIETHRQLVASDSVYFAFCEEIRSRAERVAPYRHTFAMTPEDELLFNFIHLVSHFKKGGVGIRFIADVWIYRRMTLDRTYVQSALEALGLWPFYRSIAALAERWFGDAADSAETSALPPGIVDEIERYILSGSIFGSAQNRRNAAVRNGKLRYFFHACFPGYAEMQSMFPRLRTKALLPAAWLRRGIGIVLNRRGHIRSLFDPLKNGEKDAAAELNRFFVRCGLE